MNKFCIGLLVSMLMVPVTSFSGNENPAGTGTTKSVNTVSPKTVDETAADEKLVAEVQQENKENVSKEIPNEDSNKNADLNKDNKNNENKKTFLGGVAALAWSPVTFAGKSTDWLADKCFVNSLFANLANVGFLKDNCVGKWLDAHNTGLSRAGVALVLAAVVYYGWKKCKKCNEEQNEEQEDTRWKNWEEESDYNDSEFIS